MQIEIFPYRYRRGWRKAPGRKGTVIEVPGARGLLSIYGSGAAFRIAENGTFNSVALRLGDIASDTAKSLMKAGAYLDGDIAFYPLGQEYPGNEYGLRHMEGFARLSKESGTLLLPYVSPTPIVYGRPFPNMKGTCEKVSIPYIDLSDIPMPISYGEMQAIYRIEWNIPLPPVEYVPIPEDDPEGCVWRKIIPAAFAWYHFFTHPVDAKWNVPKTAFTFADCKWAIARAMHAIGIPDRVAQPILSGALEEAYRNYSAPRLNLFTPHMGTFVHAMRSITPTPYLSKEHHDIMLAACKAHSKKRWKEIKASRPPKERRPRKYEGCTLGELDALLAAGTITRANYYRIREKFGIATRERQKYEYHSLADVEALYAAGKVGRPYYYVLRKRFRGKGNAE